MSETPDNPEQENDPVQPKEQESTTEIKPKKSIKARVFFAFLMVALLAIVGGIVDEYRHAQALVSISDTRLVNPDSGEIIVTYRFPVGSPVFHHQRTNVVNTDGEQVRAKFRSTLDETGTVETIRFSRPTPFNQTLLLRQKSPSDYKSLAYSLGLTPIPSEVEFTTPYEQVSIQDTLPTASQTHAPEALNNQIGILFEGQVGQTYKKRVKLTPRDVPFIKLSPLPSGYFQWSDNSTLTFNFTQEQPRFETTYTIEIDPEKLLDADYQQWQGDKQIALSTSSNDVYVNDVSIDKTIEWNTPITFEFSGNMVGVFELNKAKSNKVMPIVMTPDVAGTWQWLNARTVRFNPSIKGWPIRQSIAIEFLPEVNTEVDRNWTNNRDLNRIEFYVKPRVQSISYISLRGESVDPEEELTVKFSRYLVNHEDLETEWPLSKADAPVQIKPAIDGTYRWTNRKTLQIVPATPWSELTEYEISINPAYNPDARFEWSGTQAFTFKTAENVITPTFFAIPEIAPTGAAFYGNQRKYQAGEKLNAEESLWIEFNRPFGKHRANVNDIAQSIQITPTVAGEFEWLSDTLLRFTPKEGWLPETSYKVVLTDDLLYFHEQHYQPGQNELAFTTGPDNISYSMPKTVRPEDPLKLTLNKQVNPLVKPGRRYLSSEVNAEALPVSWPIDTDYEFEWTSLNTLVLYPLPYWPANIEVDFKLNDAMLPRAQSQWSDKNQIQFITGANVVSVESINPRGQTTRHSTLDIVFSKDIKPDDIELGEVEAHGLVTISPELTGDWRWQANNRLVFKPDVPLAPSTDYELMIHPNNIVSSEFTWFELDKEKQPVPYKTNFHSPYQRVKTAIATFEFDDENPLKQRFLIDLEMSEWTTLNDVEKRFTLWTVNNVDGKEVEVPLIYQFTAEENKNNVRKFRVVSNFVDRPNKDRRVYFQVERGVPALGGNATMANHFKSDFLQEKPRFIKIKDVTYSREDGRFYARLRLNAPIEPEKLKTKLTILDRNKNAPLQYQVSVDSSYRNDKQFAYRIEGQFNPDVNYRYEIDQGLLAADGTLTNQQISADYRTPSLERKVEFALQGNILSKYDAQQIPVLTSNTSYFDLGIDQVYPANVRNFLNSGLSNERSLGTAGKQVFKKRFNTKRIHNTETRNTELTTNVDLADFFRDNPKGLYRLRLYGANSKHFRWFLSSDIALIARSTNEQVNVWAMSLSDATPLAGVTIELVDYWNQTTAKVTTDANGFARLNNDNPKNTHIILATLGSDFSFLDFRTQQESFSGFDASGIASVADESLLQAYLYSERGVYRPGDVAHLVGVVRNQEGALPHHSKVTLNLKDPTGSERLTERFTIDKTGVVTLDYSVPVDAKTGKWTAELSLRKKKIGTMNFQVEEFIPNKIKVVLNSQKTVAAPGQTFTFDVQSNNLFGPPAAGRKVNGQISLRPSYFKPAGFGDYEFGHDDHRFQQVNTDLIETRLDENGHHQYEYVVPEGIDSPIGLDLHYSATVIDDSGRGVAEYAQVPVHLYEQYVGVRRTTKSTIELGDTVVFDTVNVRANGEKIASSEQHFLYKVFRKRKVTHYRKNERGYYRYVTEKIDVELTASETSDNRFEYLTEFSGEHYLQVTDINGGQVTRYYFNVIGDRDAVSIVEAPESVVLKPRQKRGYVGESLQIDVQAPFAGQLVLMAERDEVMWTKTLQMSSATTTVSIPIDQSYVPNFYLSAVVVQPAVKGSRRQPVYATGLLNVTVRDREQTPSVFINAPDKVSPNGQLSINVSVAELSRGDMYFTLAAVDEGILDLTKFKTPNMSEAFTRKQRLDVRHFSVYPWVMPFDDTVLKSVSPSGSAPSRALIKKKRENPDAAARVKSVALWSGLQKFDANGQATVTFNVPEFDGSLRIMLVAFGDQRYNASETTVTVRDDLVLKPSLPRFMATGDHFELPFTLFNSTELTGDVAIRVEHSEHVELLGNTSQTISLKAGGEAQGRFSFNVQDSLGIADFTLIAEGLNERTVKRIQVPVRTSGNYVSLSDGGTVDAVTPKTIQIPTVFKPGSEIQGLSVAPAGLLELTGSLKYLLRYPHGCLEQTTSKLFPLLYFEDFAKGADFTEFNTATPRYYLREGIDKIERMQLENGYFSYWSGGESVNHYAFLYAAHFMAEARSKGLEINEAVWNNLQYRLNEDVLKLFNEKGGYEGRYHLSHQIYALYILALSGNPRISEMNYLLDYRRKQLHVHDRVRLAAAYKLAGRTSQAETLMKDVISLSGYDNPYRQTAGTFASNTRDLAILLDALLEVAPQSNAVPLVIDKLTSLRSQGRWGSTQDNALALMALGKSIAKSGKTQNGDVIVTLPDGEEVVNQSVRLSTVDLLSGEVSIRTTGDAEASYFWQADGISNAPTVADEDSGIEIRRAFLNTKKEPVNMNNVHQGELVIVELRMKSLNGTLHNVAITDLLPMGLEIENARLSTSAEIAWLKSTAGVDHADIRDDRMNLYLSLNEREDVYYYTTRAVTIGHFAVPAVRAEAMYDESKYSMSGQSEMKVLPMQ